MENFYLIFRISPFGGPKIRAVKKEQKLYFWDWTQIREEAGARFENLVASQLLKYCHYLTDTEGFKMELRFLRDADKREVDFVVLKDKNPQFAVECQTGESALSPHLKYFAPSCWQDPAFPRAFPWFNSARYWGYHILQLREQLAALGEEPLAMP